MDEQRIARLEQAIEDLTEIAEENNALLRSMQRRARWAFWGKLLFWAVILALPFIVLGPFLHSLVPELYTSGSRGLFGLPSLEKIQSLLQVYHQATGTQ